MEMERVEGVCNEKTGRMAIAKGSGTPDAGGAWSAGHDFKQRTPSVASGAEESDANSDFLTDVRAVDHERITFYAGSDLLAKGSFNSGS